MKLRIPGSRPILIYPGEGLKSWDLEAQTKNDSSYTDKSSILATVVRTGRSAFSQAASFLRDKFSSYHTSLTAALDWSSEEHKATSHHARPGMSETDRGESHISKSTATKSAINRARILTGKARSHTWRDLFHTSSRLDSRA